MIRKENTVVIIEDEPMLRKGLGLVIRESEEFVLIGEAGQAREGLAMVERQQPDLLMLDLRLPDMDGLQIVPDVRRVSPDTRIVVFSMYVGQEHIQEALRMQVHGYITKDAAPADLMHALRMVMKGKLYVDTPAPMDAIEDDLKRDPVINTAGDDVKIDKPVLTRRQVEILELAARELTNREIAERLHLREKTVENHFSSINKRLGTRSRKEAVQAAYQRGLIHLPDASGSGPTDSRLREINTNSGLPYNWYDDDDERFRNRRQN
ncbi:response regulator [bacterium]|nr:response regulator [bacterium]